MKWVVMFLGVVAFCAALYCFIAAIFLIPENVIQQIYQLAYAMTGWICMAVFVLTVIAEKVLGVKADEAALSREAIGAHRRIDESA